MCSFCECQMKHYVLQSNAVVQRLIDRLQMVRFDKDQPIYEVTVKEYKSTRSSAQNRLYWKWMHEVSLMYHESGRELYSDEVWHEFFKKHFLPTDVKEVRGVFIEMRKTTTKLNTKSFTHYLEQIDHYSGSELEIQLSHPEDLFHFAIYGKS